MFTDLSLQFLEQNSLKATMSTTESLVFDATVISDESNIPSEFIWPHPEKGRPFPPELQIPLIDLGAFLSGDAQAVAEAVKLVDNACRKHGFFMVVNHGVDLGLIARAHSEVDKFFGMTLPEKKRAQMKPGEHLGYTSSFVGRFSSNLPWREMLSLRFCDDQQFPNVVEDYCLQVLGEDFREFGRLYQEYGEEMNKLALKIMGLLGVSLGVGEEYFREFFGGSDSIMRLNNYPACQKPELAMGAGPHCDPTSLTILHQDQVAGLEVFVDNAWYSVTPVSQAFVINIGDTFMALTNGIYKSCLHRALVNSESARRTLAFFLCPRPEKVVRPPPGLVNSETPRMYPDFTWADLLLFTQKHHRADMNTLLLFSGWLQHQQYSDRCQSTLITPIKD